MTWGTLNRKKGMIAGLIASEVPTIASFLRKNQRPLRVSSLNLLGSLIQNGLTNCDDVLVELPQLINEQDLHVAQLGKIISDFMVFHCVFSHAFGGFGIGSKNINK